VFSFSDKSKANMCCVDERLIRVAHRAIQISKIDVGIPNTGGIRSAKAQNKLFKEGKSKADGYEKISKHQEGKALDVYAWVNGSASWEKEYLAQVACAFLQAANELQIKIQWGGLWKSFEDMPHFELVD
jgi:peptidoglycan L-alanyl-D-glutamate endopeptidase CwlK